MTRRSWAELPGELRHAIESRCGGIDAVLDAPAGTACDFAGAVVTPATTVFCKVARADTRQAWMLRNEMLVNPWLPTGSAPAVLWDLTTGGWLVVAFEHVEGRHADLSPGSSDLGAIATALDRVSRCDVASWPILLQPLQDRWRSASSDADMYAGSTLLHTDPAASNLIITPHGSVVIVDWAWPGQGAPWLDAALAVTHLIRHGHHPAEAERWAATTSAWQTAHPDQLDAFAATLCSLRADQAKADPAPHRPLAAAAARAWLDHRRSAGNPRPFRRPRHPNGW